MSTPAELLAQSLAKFQTANRVDGSRNSYRKDNPTEYTVVMAYLNGGSRPTAVTSDMGVGLMLEEDARRALGVVVEPPPVEPPPPAGAVPVGVPGSWTLTFEDNFDGSALDPKVWTHKFWWNGDTGWPTEPIIMIYRAQNNIVSNGTVALRAERATPPITNWKGSTKNSQGEDFSWWSGNLSTGGIQGQMAPTFAQKYGYFESRIKMGPNGPGVWRGFWMWPVTLNGINSTYSGGYEIDIVEVVQQNPSRAEFHLHGAVSFGANYNSPTPILGGDYHVFGVNWQPGFIAFWVDGVERARYTGTGFDNAPTMYLMHDNKVGGAGSWPGDATSATPSPMDYVIDYTRAWSGS